MTDLKFDDLYLGSTFHRVVAEREGVSLTVQAYDAKGNRLRYNNSYEYLNPEHARTLARELLKQADLVEEIE
jgi:hypothetical protein